MNVAALGSVPFFTPAGAHVAALLLMRLTGIIWLAPVFSGQSVPGKVKVAILGALMAALWPAASASVEAGVGFTLMAGVREILVGLTLGFGAAVFVAAAESAGDMLAVMMGLSGANVVDPMSRTQLPVLGQLLGLTVTALILSVGGHLVMIGAVHDSLSVAPLGAALHVREGALATVELGGTLLFLGLKFAAPVMGAMMMGQVALGIMARTVPQLNVLMVAFPVQIAIGLFVLAATLPLTAAFFADWPDIYRSLASDLVLRLAPGGGS